MKNKDFSRSKHIPELDGLRGIAILMVMMAHFFNVDEAQLLIHYPFLGPFLTKISMFGTKGVELFFILSGYLITRILIHSADSQNYFKSFFIRRILRIFPLYYLILLISFFIIPFFSSIPTDAEPIFKEQWKLWSYVSNVHFFHFVEWDTPNFVNFGHFWTLSVEEHFYLLWPFLIFFIPIHTLAKWMWGIFFISLISWLLASLHPFFGWTTLTQSGSLVLGGIIAYYEFSNQNYLLKLTAWLKSNLFLLIVIFLIAIFIPRSLGFFRDFFIHILALIGFSAVLILSLHQKSKILTAQWLIFIGKISYGIYIFHAWLRPFYKTYFYQKWVILYGPSHVLEITAAYTVLSILISVLFAWISWEIFEKHLLKLKRTFTYA